MAHAAGLQGAEEAHRSEIVAVPVEVRVGDRLGNVDEGRKAHCGDGAVLRNLTGVTRVNDAGKHAEFVLAPGTEPDDLLQQIVGRVKVRRFDTREASLHEIFVRAVGSDTTVRGE